MLLLAAGFKPKKESNELILSAAHLAAAQTPDWVKIILEESAAEEK
jgi:hypothetical protein